MKTANDIIDINGCIVKDDAGVAMATIWETENGLVVERFPACSLGMYFYILGYLRELGFEIYS